MSLAVLQWIVISFIPDIKMVESSSKTQLAQTDTAVTDHRQKNSISLPFQEPHKYPSITLVHYHCFHFYVMCLNSVYFILYLRPFHPVYLHFLEFISEIEDRVVVVGCLLNVPATCKCISGTDLHRQFYVLPHRDRSCRPNFPSHPVTVYWHQADQPQHWP